MRNIYERILVAEKRTGRTAGEDEFREAVRTWIRKVIRRMLAFCLSEMGKHRTRCCAICHQNHKGVGRHEDFQRKKWFRRNLKAIRVSVKDGERTEVWGPHGGKDTISKAQFYSGTHVLGNTGRRMPFHCLLQLIKSSRV